MGDLRTRPGHGVTWPAVLGLLVALTFFQAVSADYITVPDLTFSNQTLFKTDMVSSDLDEARKAEIRSALQPQLARVFANITGFKSVEVTGITIDEQNKILIANWTVRLDRNNPEFVNATPEEIGDIVRPQLEQASKVYRDVITIDTSKRESSSTPASPDDDGNNNLGLGLGLALGLGLPALALLILAVVLLARRKKTPTPKPPPSSSLGTSSRFSQGSSDLDQKHYRYTHNVNGGFVPSMSGKSGSGSVSTCSDYITPDIYDTIDSTAGSVASGVYVDLDDVVIDRNYSRRH